MPREPVASERVKVLHCIPGLGGGGAERQLAYLAGPLNRLNWDVHVAAVAAGPNLPRLVAGGARLHRIDAAHNHDPRLAWQLSQIVRRVRPDLIQVWFVQMEVLGGLVAETFRIPWILSERSSRGAYPATLKNRARVLIARTADAIVANSRGGLEYWDGRVPDRIPRVVIPNALPLDEIDAAEPAAPPGLALSPEDRLVLFAGRFGPEKNIAGLLAALRTVVQRPHTKAVLCGTGELRARVALEIAGAGLGDRILLPGYVDTLWPLMKRADVVVSVGFFEGRPNTVIEAMACGRPLVVSDIPAHREILDERAAFWVDPRDPSGIAAALVAVLENPAEGRMRGESARTRSRNWSIQRAAEEYDRIYRQVIASCAAS